MELRFNEGLFVPRNEIAYTQKTKRREFLGYVRHIIAFYQAGNTPTSSYSVQSFSLAMSRSHSYASDVNEFIRFAVSRGVKHLELEFYDPVREHGRAIDPAQGFPLPELVYKHHQKLQTLKLVWCNFRASKFKSFNSLETLTLAWVTITTNELRDLVASCPILNTLRLQFCMVINALEISVPGNCTLKNLVVERCNVGMDLFALVGPELRKFIYTGKVARFRMGNQSELIEARLDFGEQLEFKTGPSLCQLLEQLVNVRIMTVCSVFLQIIPSGERPHRTVLDLNVQHLTMNTELHANEFIGIKFMLASCPRMNTLTLYLGPGKIFVNYEGPYDTTSPSNFWREPDRVETCLRESLLELNVHGFQGTYNEMTVIDYIIRYGHCLRSVNLYVPQAFDQNFVAFLLRKASELGGANPRGLKISVLTPSLLLNQID